MTSRLTIVASAFAALSLAACSGASEEAPVEQASEEPADESLFVPADFEVPVRVEADGFTLVPLGPEVVDVDYEAYMSSIEHIQETFTRSTSWPHADLDAEDAMQDMLNEQRRFEARESFAYAVLTPDGTRERGSLYVSPSEVADYDVVVRMWVTKAEYDAGFDEELYAWAQEWIAEEWPFAKVAYPGRAIAWEEWDALVEAAGDAQAN